MRNSYSLEEMIKNVISLIYTKVFFRNARLIRRPFYLRGREYLQYGAGFTTGYSCRVEMFCIEPNFNKNQKKLIIGSNCKLGDFVHLAAGERIIIGDNCLFASKIYVSDIVHGKYDNEVDNTSPEIPPDERKLFTKPVIIEDNVWIGENVSILPGVHIGYGSVIGANSVVNKDIPALSIAVGCPARIVKSYNSNLHIWEKTEKQKILKLCAKE